MGGSSDINSGARLLSMFTPHGAGRVAAMGPFRKSACSFGAESGRVNAQPPFTPAPPERRWEQLCQAIRSKKVWHSTGE